MNLEEFKKKDESIQFKTYLDTLGLTDKDALRYGLFLYHGIRFDSLNRLESIFKTGYILPGNKINTSFKSFNGENKYLYINSYSDENCNKGEFISVMPNENELEFNTFVRRNIFFIINPSVKAYKTNFLSYDDYIELRESNINYKNLYSYAHNEYLVEEPISLNDCLYLGIDYRYFYGDYDNTVKDVINLINAYEIKMPFIEYYNYDEIYNYEENKKIRMRNK